MILKLFLRDEWLNFLSSILTACNLNIGDIAIVNYAQNNISFSNLQQHLQPVYVLLFDVTMQELQLPLTSTFYQQQQYNNCTFLSAPSLQAMQGNTNEVKMEKSKLWLALKNMFKI
jgi:hypothetical protein